MGDGMEALDRDLELVIERFRLMHALPEVKSWSRNSEGIPGRYWNELRFDGRFVLIIYSSGIIWAKNQVKGNGLTGSTHEIITWLRINGLDVRPEPERYGLIGSEIHHGKDAVTWTWPGMDEQLHWHPKVDKPWSVVWDFGDMESFVTCKEACQYIMKITRVKR